jgi:hypothetical protein
VFMFRGVRESIDEGVLGRREARCRRGHRIQMPGAEGDSEDRAIGCEDMV